MLDNDYDLGLNELRDSESVLVIEWYEYLKELDIKDYLLIDFIYLDENTRKLVFTSDNDEYLKIVKKQTRIKRTRRKDRRNFMS